MKTAEWEAPGIRLPPRQQLHRQNLSDITVLEFGSLLKACNIQGKVCTVNWGKFPSISALSPSQLCICSWSSLHTAWGTQVGQKGLYFPDTGELCSDCWLLLLITEVQRGQQPLLLHLPPLLHAPPLWLKWLTGYKGPTPFLPHFIFCFFSLWEPDIRVGYSKTTAYSGMSGKGSEKNWEDLKFTHQADPQHRDILQNQPSTPNIQKQ